jgi:hypothetical protein
LTPEAAMGGGRAPEADMNQTIENTRHKGVICLFCGESTSLSNQAVQRHSANPHELRAWIVRCHRCCKEALYLPDEIVDLQAA